MVFGGFLDEPQRTRPKFTTKEKDALYKQQGGKCKGCSKKFEMRNMAVDHIRPFSKGGSERLTNLQLLCTSCNTLKGAGTMAELKKKLQAKGYIKSPPKSTATSAAKKTIASKANTKKRTVRKPRDPFVDFFGS